MTDFDEWFQAQHGTRPTSSHNDADLVRMMVDGERARVDLESRRRWDAMRTSALHAWQISDAERIAAKWRKP